MASFYFDRHSREPYNEQWTRFLQTGSHVNDLQTVIKDQTSGLQQTLTAVSREHRQIIEKSAAAVCQTLEKGFSQVVEQLDQANWQLNEISHGIGNLHAMLDWKTDIIIEQLYINNNYLRQISELLRIPDSQKQKALHIENGLKFLHNGLQNLNMSRHFSDALEEFNLSIQIERRDFFTLHRLGIIHFYSQSHLNIQQAYEYFCDAAHYAQAESTIDSSNRNYSLSRFPQEKTNKAVYLEEASNSLIFASRCCYLLGNLQEAILKAQEAWRLTPQFPEAGFQLVKMLGAARQAAPAAHVLEDVINLNRYYAIKAIEDFDIIQHHEVQNKLDAIRNWYVDEAKTKLAECRRKMIPSSKAAPFLQEIELLINKNNLIDAKKAMDIFQSTIEWSYSSYRIVRNTGYPESESLYYEYNYNPKKITLIEYIHKEAERDQAIKNAEIEIADFNRKKKSEWQENKVQKTVRNIAIFVAILIVLIITGAVISNNSGKDFSKSRNYPISDQTINHTPDTIFNSVAGKYEQINYSELEWSELTDLAFDKQQKAFDFKARLEKWADKNKNNLEISDGGLLGESLTCINELMNAYEEIVKRLENDQAPYTRYKNRDKFIKNVKLSIYNYYLWNNMADAIIEIIKKNFTPDNRHKLETHKHEIDISRLVDILKEIDPQSEGKSIKEIANDYEQSSRQ
jgi:hypothetical protein